MSPQIIGLVCIILLLILLYSRMWIGLVILFVAVAGGIAILGWKMELEVLALVPFRTVNSYTIAALPMFVLLGTIVANTGFAADLFKAANKWIGQFRGGLAMATCVSCTILGVITDSTITNITMGKTAVPEMRKYNYNEGFANAVVVAGGSLASLIPPSTGFIIFGILTNTSISALYVAGIIPGILLLILMVLMIFIMIRVKKGLSQASPRTSFKEKVVSLKYTWAVLLIIVLIIGGIYAGIFTATEAGAVGSVGCIIVGLASRQLNGKVLVNSILETARMTAMIILLMSSTYVFMNMMTVSKIPFTLSGYIAGIHLSPHFIIVLIFLIYLILGMFTDIVSSILLTIPIIFPVVKSLGFDPVWFGVFVCMIVEIGDISPPLGMNVFILSGVTKTPIKDIFSASWPFLGLLVLFVIILILFPQLALWLPGTMSV